MGGISADTDGGGSPGVRCHEDRPIFAIDRPDKELIGKPLATTAVRARSIIPTPSLLRSDKAGQNVTANRKSEVSGLEVTGWMHLGDTQIYEGTNQIQKVVIAKRLLG